MTRSVFVVYNKITKNYAGPSYGFRDFENCEVYLKKNGATARKNSMTNSYSGYYITIDGEQRKLSADDLEVIEIKVGAPR